MNYDLKRSEDLRWLFDHRCYIHLRWSCFSDISNTSIRTYTSDTSKASKTLALLVALFLRFLSFVLLSFDSYFRILRREAVKKNGYFTVRLTVSVYPPPSYGQLFVNLFLCVFYLRLWFSVLWNGFYTRKVIFIQLQEFLTPPYCRYCSVTKLSASSVTEALKALKMQFWVS